MFASVYRVAGIAAAFVSLCATEALRAQTEHARSVRFVYELENSGRKPIRNVELRLVLPPNLPRQTVDLLEVGRGGTVRKDAFGNRVAVFRKPELAPGRTFVGQWFATVRLRAVDVWKSSAKRPVLRREERERYLRNRSAYQIRDPWLCDLALDTVRGVEGRVAQVRALHDLVLEKMRYVRDGRWDSAPTCLRRGEGSCSEYTYSLVALCRSLGIPARWAGSTALRKDRDSTAYFDEVFHRWAEVWLPERGWVPVDCSRNDGEEGRASAKWFGRLPWQLLVLARGDGGKGSLTGWAYHARGLWNGTGATSRRCGIWTDAVSRDELSTLAKTKSRAAGRRRSPAARQAHLFLEGCGIEPPVRVVPATTRR